MDNFYKELIAKYEEHDIRSLGWSSMEGQEKRFKVFLQEMNPYRKSFLDVGCGFGDIYPNIELRQGEYVGIDIEPEMIKIAKKSYPEAKFFNVDIMTVDGTFDYVIASGMFGLKREYWKLFMARTVRKMFNICKIAIGFNFTRFVSRFNPQAYYTSPGEVIERLSRYDVTDIQTKIIKIRLDYLPNDFTIILYK